MERERKKNICIQLLLISSLCHPGFRVSGTIKEGDLKGRHGGSGGVGGAALQPRPARTPILKAQQVDGSAGGIKGRKGSQRMREQDAGREPLVLRRRRDE